MANSWRTWRGEEIENILNGICEQAITETLNSVGNTTDSIIPLDEGPLMNSRYEETKSSKSKSEGVLSYGGGSGTGKPKLPYAIRWHENNANFQHGRQSNYLRGPFNRIAVKKIKNILISKINSRF
jgi:hypothetical protein